MRNIQFKDKFVLKFEKPWSEDEKSMAACLGMKIEQGFIYADTRAIAPQPIKDFLFFAFPTIMMSDREQRFRDNLFAHLNTVYKEIYNDFLNNYYPKTNYSRELFKHQKRSLSLMIHRQHNLLSFEQGLGKTITSATLSKILGISRTIIIAPAGVKWNWFHDMTDDWGYDKMLWTILDSKKSRCIYAFNERFVVVNYEMISKHFAHLTRFKVGHIIIDECFPYNTPIITDQGLLMIGDIVENKINCNALSCDLSSNVLSFQKIVFHHKNKRKNEYIKIKHSKGEFTCTRNHKIYVEEKGFKRADELLDGDNLRMLRKDTLNKVSWEENSEVLFCNMFNHTKEEIPRMEKLLNKSVRSSEKITAKKRAFLRNMLNKIQSSSIFKSKVLFNIVFCKMENGSEGYKNNGLYQQEISKNKGEAIIVSSKQSREKEKSFNTNERGQSYVEAGNKGENDSVKQRENFFEQGREWAANKAANYPIGNNWTADGTCNKHEGSSAFISERAESLQSGFGLCGEKDSDRGRWVYAQTEEMEVLGQKENGNFECVRVESVEILERGSRQESREMCSGDYVYNIEVENNHNYFANNILVSNCQKIKNVKTANYKAVSKLVKTFPQARVTLLSGTPITNRVNDIFAYFKLCNHPLGSNYAEFIRKYTINTTGRGGVKIIGAQNVDDLRVRISNFMIRKRTEECIDLPALLIKKYYFDMGDIRGEYEQHIKELYEHKKNLEDATTSQQKSEIGMKIKGNIHTLNRMLATSKVANVIPLIDQLIENGRDVIVFSGYRAPILELERHYGDACVKVIGGMDAHEKDKAIQKFTKNPNCNLFLGNFKAAGVGINLVNSRDVIFLNFPFTPDDLEQPYKRAHRIGQKENVNAYYTIVKDSIDEHIFNMIVGKTQDINSILDEGKDGVVHYKQIPNDLFNRLVADYEKKNNINQGEKEFSSIK